MRRQLWAVVKRGRVTEIHTAQAHTEKKTEREREIKTEKLKRERREENYEERRERREEKDGERD